MPSASKKLSTNSKRRYLVIHNPSSGRFWDRRAIKKTVSRFQKNHIKYDVVTVDRSDPKQVHWKKIENIIKQTHDPRLIVIGGDGTLRRALEFLVQHNLDLEIGFIPSGTANIVAHSLKIPRRPKAALEKILYGKPKLLDLGQVNDKNIIIIDACF